MGLKERSDMQEKTYEINGKTYVHRPQVLGQLKQLEELLKGTNIPAGAGAMGIVEALGDKVPIALAIILTGQGKSPQDKDLEALAAEMLWGVDLAQTMEIVDDFFSINPLSSAFAKVVGMMERFAEQVLAMQTGSSPSASPSGTEI